jgi:hypothetical protein
MNMNDTERRVHLQTLHINRKTTEKRIIGLRKAIHKLNDQLEEELRLLDDIDRSEHWLKVG